MEFLLFSLPVSQHRDQVVSPLTFLLLNPQRNHRVILRCSHLVNRLMSQRVSLVLLLRLSRLVCQVLNPLANLPVSPLQDRQDSRQEFQPDSRL